MSLRLPLKFFGRKLPISGVYGLDRGKAIDRLYIEDFLSQNQRYIKGRCLEVLNDDYTKRFGGKKVLKSDVLDINPDNTGATIVSDLRKMDRIESNSYDCIILTQVLQFIDDAPAALAECRRILKKGGTLLATVPVMSRMDVASGVDNDFWRFTGAGAKFLFGKAFGAGQIRVQSHGNVLTGLAFWVGLAQEDLRHRDFEADDPNFPLLVTVRAVK